MLCFCIIHFIPGTGKCLLYLTVEHKGGAGKPAEAAVGEHGRVLQGCDDGNKPERAIPCEEAAQNLDAAIVSVGTEMRACQQGVGERPPSIFKKYPSFMFSILS